MTETKMLLGREVTISDDGQIAINKQKYTPFTAGALKVARSFGYMYDWEVLVLQAFVRGLPLNAKVVNIGAGAGTSGLAMAEARMDLIPNIYTVDIAQDGGPLGGLVSEQNAFRSYNTPLVNQILGDSAAVGVAWDKGPLDLVFVDGNHSGYGVECDINAWLPHIKDGGFMIFHDFGHSQWGQIKPTVERLMAEYDQLMVVDLLAVYRIHKKPAAVCCADAPAAQEPVVKAPRKPRKPKEE